MLLIALTTVFMYLLSNGSLISINVTTMQSTALLNVTLPVRPMGPIIVQNSSGSTIPAILIGNHLVIPVFGNGSFIIKYVPYIASLPSGYLAINVSSPYTINLFVSNNILLTQLPIGLITNFTKMNNGILLQLAPGNYSIGFIPELPTTTTTTTSANRSSTITTTTNTTTPSTTKTTTSSLGIGSVLYYIITAVIIVTAVLLTYLFVIRHRGPEINPVIVEGLNPTDKDVVKALIDMGGEAYQADLQRKLNMPKATLWRAIRRLESAGYVQIIKEGRVNKIRLIKKPKLD